MLEPDESPDDAAIREAREELGVEVQLRHLIGVYYVRRRTRRPRIGFVFLGTISHGSPAVSDDELDGMGWFPLDALPEPISPGLGSVIRDGLEGHRGVMRTIDDLQP
jgi:8-oxo-dGTP pyrophosphatase MutT (NUDIX family)